MLRPLVIALAETDPQRLKVLAFIDAVFFKHFGVRPSPPQLLFAACDDEAVVGSIALDFPDQGGRLPYDGLFTAAARQTGFLGHNRRAVQFSRWTAARPGVSAAVFYAATLFALDHGKRFVWCVAKDPAASRVREIGMRLRAVPHAAVLPERVTECREYYLAIPPPQLYLMHLKQMQRALYAVVAPRIASGEFVFPTRASTDSP